MNEGIISYFGKLALWLVVPLGLLKLWSIPPLHLFSLKLDMSLLYECILSLWPLCFSITFLHLFLSVEVFQGSFFDQFSTLPW